MKKKGTAQSAFLNLRGLTALALCAAAACSIVSGRLLGSFRTETPANLYQRTLAFAERVSYQRAIEEVYWRHRIWPKENSKPKPSLDVVMSLVQLENKVMDYLRKSEALEHYWQRPISADQLQSEMDRMAKYTKQPGVLRELFEALGNEPFVIAECLARPAIAEQLVTKFYAHDSYPLAPRRVRAENQMPKLIAAAGSYRLPTISSGAACSDDTWMATSTNNAPSARPGHTAVWTGSEMIVWGGYNLRQIGAATQIDGSTLNTGGRYTPSTDSWTATSTINAPGARASHTAVWTGSEMIVWGGYLPGVTNTGGKYNPGTDSWTATSTTNAPDARGGHTGVWTGSEMIVWGGFGGTNLNTGGIYNPTVDSWTATSITNAPDARSDHTAVWAGSEVIVWGGHDDNFFLFDTGGRYDPGTNSWIPTSTTNAPLGRTRHTAAWTGSEMIVWGGLAETGFPTSTGGRFNPATNSWTATTLTNAPSARQIHTGVWTGSENVVWGGIEESLQYPNAGGRYNPDVDSWIATSTINGPSGRISHTAVWTGSEMIVWGGDNPSQLNTGGRYCAQSEATPTPSPTATPTPAPRATPLPRPHPTPHPRP
jgi:N-acetylneuraminic acid mutarotase